MSETNQSKREHWQRMRDNLPADLRPHVSLRNVEAVSALSPKAQARLAEAIRAGLKRLPRAIEQLRENADAPLAELLNPTQIADTQSHGEFSKEVQGELADLVQVCYPDMPRVSAEALAESEAMQVVRKVAEAIDTTFASRHMKADFVLTVLYALVSQSLDRLETLIAEAPAVQQILAQSDLPHIPTQWRHSNA